LTTISELLKEVERRKLIVENYYRNYRLHVNSKNYSKASEDLWGVVNNLLIILSLVMTGKSVSSHSALRDFVNQLIAIKRNEKLRELFRAAERLHANYFHNFMDEEMFNEDREKVEELIRILEQYILEELEKLRSFY